MAYGKAFGVWLVMVAAAIGNGLLRERLLVPWLGGSVALPASGVLLSFFILIITWVALPIFGKLRGISYLGLGLLWCCSTLAFEFGFGHYIVGKAWREILQVFNPTRGNLFSFDLVVTFFSPWLAARLRKYI
ncbi:MAG: hypothetical protein P8130_09360 [Deltaproteobacteria bacterium]